MDTKNLVSTGDPLVMRDKRNRVAYTRRLCEGCGSLAWIRKGRRYCSHSCSALNHRGEKSYNWAGNAPGYSTMHKRVNHLRGKAEHCIHRNAIGCTSTTYNWAWIHGEDPHDIYSYVPLCRSCHNQYDLDQRWYDTQRGSQNVHAQLTVEIVAEVRSRPVVNITEWAREFDVTYATMKDVVNFETWKHVPTGAVS
jgi:hypothetical protein